MYSPKIKEEYIPYLYQLARHLGLPMTKLVNQIIAPVIERFISSGIFAKLEEERLVNELTVHFRKLIEQKRTDTARVIELFEENCVR